MTDKNKVNLCDDFFSCNGLEITGRGSPFT